MTFDEMATLESVFNTAIQMTDDATDQSCIVKMSERFGLELDGLTVAPSNEFSPSYEADSSGELHEVDAEFKEEGSQDHAITD